MTQLHLTSDFERFHLHTERIWSRVLSGHDQPPGYCTQAFAPPVDIYERDGEVVVVMEVAGVRGSELRLTLDGQRLTVGGVRHDYLFSDARTYTQIEVCRGEFRRTVTLPCPVNAEDATIAYEDGFLRLTFAKVPPAPGERRTTISRRAP